MSETGADVTRCDSGYEFFVTDCAGVRNRDHFHMFISYQRSQNINKIAHWMTEIGSDMLLSDFLDLKKQFREAIFEGACIFAVSSNTITDEMGQRYIEDLEGERFVDDSGFQIDRS